MSLVSYSYSTDSEDDLENISELQHQECAKSNQLSTNYNISMKQPYKKNTSSNSMEINCKHNKVIIPAFNCNSDDNETNYEKCIKLKCTKNQSSLLDILPEPKCSRSNKFENSTRKHSTLIPINALKNFQNNQNNDEKENVTENDNLLISNVNLTEIYTLNKNSINVKSAKNKYNTEAENINSINLSEYQCKRLKKCASNIRNINVTNMLEYQKSRILKNSTEEFYKAPQENVEEPSLRSRKKNHITYLAYKAKINEQDLKNQWSLNKMTRQETRAKYGF